MAVEISSEFRDPLGVDVLDKGFSASCKGSLGGKSSVNSRLRGKCCLFGLSEVEESFVVVLLSLRDRLLVILRDLLDLAVPSSELLPLDPLPLLLSLSPNLPIAAMVARRPL